MGKRFSAGVLGGLAAVALSAAACGLGFSDIELGADPAPTPTGTGPIDGTSPIPTTPPTVPTPEADAATDGDALANLDAGANLDAADARPPATTARPAFVFRFELNGICGLFPTVYCTQNDGTFGRFARYRGMGAEIRDTPNNTGINLWRATNDGTGFLEMDDATNAIPAGNTTKLTVAAWVRRNGDSRIMPRIVSFGPPTGGGGGGKAIFEFGLTGTNDTKPVLSIDDDLEMGEQYGTPNQVPANTWVFLAATYDKDLANRVCFYRGTESSAVEDLGCRAYQGKDVKRVPSARLAVGGPANDRHRANSDRTFSGFLDNVFVYFGDALPMDQIEALRTD